MSNTQAPLAIVPSQTPSAVVPKTPSLERLDYHWKLAGLVCQSGMSKYRSQADAFFVIRYGDELGIPEMTSLRTLNSINGGPPSCSGEAMLALIRKSGKVSVSISDNASTFAAGKATVHMKRIDSGDEYTATWGREDDARARLNSNRDKYPAQMWTWRAVSIAAKALCSDIVGGLYTNEEMYPEAELDENGEIVEKPIADAPRLPAPAAGSIPANGKKVAPELGQKHGPIGREKPVEAPVVPPAPEEPPMSEHHEESHHEEETKPHWSAVEEQRNYIVGAIQNQTGDKTLLWETVKTLVPGDATSYGGQEFATLAVAGWKAKQKPAGTRLGQPATTAAAPAPQSQKQPAQDVIIDAVRYIQSGNTRYLEFAKGNLRIRRYDRSGTFRKEVGDEYYNENGFEQMVPMTAGDEPYSINPIQIFYEAKDGYNVATKCIPITDETALDQYFGDIPFPEAG